MDFDKRAEDKTNTNTNVYFSIKRISGGEVVANAYLGVDGNLL